MALSVKDIQTAYVAFFNRPADVDGLNYWLEYAGNSLDLLNTFAVQSEYAELFEGLSNEEAVNLVYQNLLGRDADEEGLAYWADALAAGTVSLGSLAVAIIAGAQNDDVTVIENKVAAATAFTDSLDTDAEADAYAGAADLSSVKEWLGAVGADAASLEAAKASIGGVVGGLEPVEPQEPGSSVYLDTTRDILTGTAGDDTFVGNIFDNSNTLQSGDVINGGAGFDTLLADVGNSQNFAITPELTNVEVVKIRAQTTPEDDADNNITDGAQIDAERSVGVEHWESNNSRADLVIEDVRIRDSQVTKDITIAMVNTDPGNVDFAVYFDQQSLRASPQTETGAVLNIELMDTRNAVAGNDPLENNPFDGFTFTLTVNGQDTQVEIRSAGIDAATTYAELLAAISAAVEAKAAEIPALANFTVEFSGTFNAVDTESGLSATGQRITLVNNGEGSITSGNYTTATGGVPGSTGLHTNQTTTSPIDVDHLITSTVVLDNVGRGSMGGDLVIGGLSVGDTSTSRGVEQFDITVERSSKLQQVTSTNDTLEVVNIVNGGVKGDLTVTGDVEETPFAEFSGKPNLSGSRGNQAIDGVYADGNGFGFTNVREINASTFEGKLNLNAVLDGNVIAKYEDLFDEAGSPAADNIEFSYELGTNDDQFFLAIGSGNFASPDLGTTTREDFDLVIEGGAGNDVIDTVIFSQALSSENMANANGGDAHWYINSSLNANLEIDAGAGNDTVSTHGSGNWVVELGTGNDTYYADNSGDKAAWVLNAQNDSLNNLESDANDRYGFFKTSVTVSLTRADGSVYTTAVPVTVASTSNRSSDLQMNQAIKAAINSDPVLSKLLVATDGPANTLVVESLIDEQYYGDSVLHIGLSAPSAASLTLAEVASYAAAHGLGAGATSAQVVSAIQAQIAAWNTKADYNVGLSGADEAVNGDYSNHTADNIITGGEGNDVLVLGTGFDSNDTIVYEGFGNGVDTVVNFDTSNDLAWQGTGAAKETVVLTFSDSDGDPAAQTIIFQGQTITLSAPADQGVIPAVDVAYQFHQQFAVAGWVASHTANTGVVTLVRAQNGEVTDVVAADFTGTYKADGAGVVTVNTSVQGADGYIDGQVSTFTVTFDVAATAANAAGAFTFASETVNYVEGDGAITLAATLLAHDWTATDWTVTAGATPNSVVFTSAVPTLVGTTYEDAYAIGAAADFDLGSNTIVGSISGAVGTAARAGEAVVTTGDGIDYIDFSSYDVDAVYVGNTLVAGTAPAAANETYVQLIESGTNDGLYTATVYSAGANNAFGGADDVSVGVIGQIDFGDTQQFLSDNFII